MGCSGSTGLSGNLNALGKGEFQLGGTFRYFRSYKHFKSDSEQKQRVEQGTEVINVAPSLDLSLAYGLTNRLSVALNVPLLYYDRSSLYEHYGNTAGNPRFHTKASGLGDIRLSGLFWLDGSEKAAKRNLAIGLGVKLPTGKSDVTDEFHKKKVSDGADSIVVKPVDQSIQLGDGGVGISLELQGYTSLSKRAALYFNGFYLLNPKEVNSTVSKVLNSKSTARDSITAFYSVADQWAVRFGVNYSVLPAAGISASLGVRGEGIPAHDLVGGSNGFRRPGFIVNAEPGLAWQHNSVSVVLSVPVALYRNRVKSVSDLADPAGLANGDAAFADYAVNLSVAYRFGGQHAAMVPAVPAFPNATKH